MRPENSLRSQLWCNTFVVGTHHFSKQILPCVQSRLLSLLVGLNPPAKKKASCTQIRFHAIVAGKPFGGFSTKDATRVLLMDFHHKTGQPTRGSLFATWPSALAPGFGLWTVRPPGEAELCRVETLGGGTPGPARVCVSSFFLFCGGGATLKFVSGRPQLVVLIGGLVIRWGWWFGFGFDPLAFKWRINWQLPCNTKPAIHTNNCREADMSCVLTSRKILKRGYPDKA